VLNIINMYMYILFNLTTPYQFHDYTNSLITLQPLLDFPYFVPLPITIPITTLILLPDLFTYLITIFSTTTNIYYLITLYQKSNHILNHKHLIPFINYPITLCQ